jgi:hypothetical protein
MEALCRAALRTLCRDPLRDRPPCIRCRSTVRRVVRCDVDVLAARSPHNIVRIDVPRGGEDRYELAAKTLQDWLNEAFFAVEAEPSFTIYRMRFTDSTGVRRDIAGVLGGLEVVDAEAGGVLPHERTTAKASTDRLDLTRATAANLSPVWGLSLSKGLTGASRRAWRAAGYGNRGRNRACGGTGHRSTPDCSNHRQAGLR